MESNTDSQVESKDVYSGVDTKLSELMLKGWTMLASTCPLEECRCPLMRSPGHDKQKYCCRCETWIYYNKDPQPKNFKELLSSSAIQSNNKTMEIIQEPSQNQMIKSEESTLVTSNKPKTNMLTVLNDKINSLSQQLASETDYKLIKILLEDINLCIENIKEYKQL